MRLRCKQCGYKFEPKTDRKLKDCPYCGAKGSLIIEEDILKELL